VSGLFRGHSRDSGASPPSVEHAQGRALFRRWLGFEREHELPGRLESFAGSEGPGEAPRRCLPPPLSPRIAPSLKGHDVTSPRSPRTDESFRVTLPWDRRGPVTHPNRRRTLILLGCDPVTLPEAGERGRSVPRHPRSPRGDSPWLSPTRCGRSW